MNALFSPRASRRERRGVAGLLAALALVTPAALGDAARAECVILPEAVLSLLRVAENGLPASNLSVYGSSSASLWHDGAETRLVFRADRVTFTSSWVEGYRVAPPPRR